MKVIYHWTGEYRPPKKGEWFWSQGKPRQAIEDWALCRFILDRQEIPDPEKEGEDGKT